MRVILPFAYQVSSEDQKTGKNVNSWFTDHVSADIPELAVDEVDLVASWRNLSGNEYADCVIHWNGCLYQRASGPLPLDKRNLPSRLEDLAEINAFHSRNFPLNTRLLERVYGFPTGNEAKALDKALQGNPRAPAPAKGHRHVSSTVEDDRIEAQGMVSGLLICGTEVFCKIPSIMVSSGLHDNTTFVFIKPGLYGSRKRERLAGADVVPWDRSTIYFPVSEFDRAVTLAGENAVVLVDNVRIRRPDLAAVDGDDATYADLVSYVVTSSAKSLSDMDQDTVRQWLRLRDAVRSHYSSDTLPISAEVIADLRELTARHPVRDSARIIEKTLATFDEWRTQSEATPAREPRR